MNKAQFMKLQGTSGAIYAEYARRPNGERLFASLQYGNYGEKGVFVARFLTVDPLGQYKNFVHFTPRGIHTYLPENVDSVERTPAMTLNKLTIPVFDPAVPPSLVAQMGDKFMLWEVLADWLAEQAKKDGFEPVETSELSVEIRSWFEASVNPDSIKLALEFPDLELLKQAGYNSHKPTFSENNDFGGFGGDEDEEPDSDA